MVFRHGNRPFFHFALVLIAVTVAFWIVAAVHICRYGGAEKPLGWTASWRSGAWFVQVVVPGGPAEGRLLPGDRIIALDGDSRAAEIGPEWFLRDKPRQTQYIVQVVRSGQEFQFTVDWPIKHPHQKRNWLLSDLLAAFTFLVIGTILAFAKPDDPTAQRGFVVAILGSWFWILLSLDPGSGMLSGTVLAIAMVLNGVRPYHILAGYYFYARFPEPMPERKNWRRMEGTLNIVAFLIWACNAYAALLRGLGPETGVALAARQWPFTLVFQRLVDPSLTLFSGACALAIAAVCWRNYRELPAGDQRRRVLWVIWGTLVAIGPLILAAPILALVKSGFAPPEWTEPVGRFVRVGNTFTVIIPVVICYAIIRHRVLGIRVVLRTGLRYLLARNSLRVVLALPLVLIGWSLVSNPDRTLGEILIGPGSTLNLVLAGLFALTLRYRRQLFQRIDRQFFREEYRQDRVLITLADSIPKLDDAGEISELLQTEIQAALHPKSMSLVHWELEERQAGMSSSGAGLGDGRIKIPRGVEAQVRALPQALDLGQPGGTVRTDVSDLLLGLGVQLVVPIHGADGRSVSTLLLGEKRSEEPYTQNDHQLLDAIVAQTGLAWENLSLRSRLKRERDERENVLARLDDRVTDLVRECPRCGSCYDGNVEKCELDGSVLEHRLPVPRLLDGKYRLERLVGRGGMGAVYEARDLRLDRVVAVKVMMSRLFGDASALHRFQREARASAKLDHPNVVRVYDCGELPGDGAYLILEFLAGITLRRELRESGPLSPLVAAQILEQIFSGVEAAHGQRIIHRDLKPDNVMLLRHAEGAVTPKILDFGLAVVRDLDFSDPASQTAAGLALGTISYMSREQFLGETVDERTDVYSLGVIALEILTGELGLRGPSFSKMASLVRQRLSSGEENAPAGETVAAVLLRAVAEDDAERTRSVAVLREELCPLILRLGTKSPFAHSAGGSGAISRTDTLTRPLSGKDGVDRERSVG